MEGWLIRGRGGVYTAEDAAGVQYTLRAKNRFRRLRVSPPLRSVRSRPAEMTVPKTMRWGSCWKYARCPKRKISPKK